MEQAGVGVYRFALLPTAAHCIHSLSSHTELRSAFSMSPFLKHWKHQYRRAFFMHITFKQSQSHGGVKKKSILKFTSS